MRVFYAVTFHDIDKEKITRLRDVVANQSIKGRFTLQENFHITLAFVGEVPSYQIDSLCDILEGLTPNISSVRGEYIGSFKRRDREILWLGIEKNPELKVLHKILVNHLIHEGYTIEKRKYTPHITLGRQVLMQQDISSFMIEPFDLPIKSIALMESKRIGEKLVYEVIDEIYHV